MSSIRFLAIAAAAGFFIIVGVAIEARFGPFARMAGGFWPPAITSPTGECDLACVENLLAQRGIAASSAIMAMLNMVSVTLLGMSIYLLWRNLGEAKKLTRSAELSLQEAKRATDEMVEANGKQLRAYLTFGQAEVQYDGPARPVEIRFTYQNSGQTPARDVRVSVMSFYCPTEDSSSNLHEMLPVEDSKNRSDLGGHQQARGKFTLPFGEHTNLALANDNLASRSVDMVVFLTLEYKDISNSQRTTTVEYRRPLREIIDFRRTSTTESGRRLPALHRQRTIAFS